MKGYSYVHLANDFNSTMFTDCCDTAITDSQLECPRCGNEIYGASCNSDHERRLLRWRYAFKK